MNERIKELAKQAGFAMEIDNDPNSPPGWWGAGHNPTFEKFAELIIKECCEVAREWEDDYVVEDTAPSHVDIKIEKHFGVK